MGNGGPLSHEEVDGRGVPSKVCGGKVAKNVLGDGICTLGIKPVLATYSHRCQNVETRPGTSIDVNGLHGTVHVLRIAHHCATWYNRQRGEVGRFDAG